MTEQHRRKPPSSAPSPQKHKPGPRPFVPTAAQRRRITRGIAIGLTLGQLASDVGMPVSSMRRAFADEIRLGRVRAILDNLDLLHEAAERGSVPAMKELARMMQAVEPAGREDEDDWSDVTNGRANNLGRNLDFH